MADRRDNFSARVVRIVALRAGYLCSNPDCRRPTAGPHSDPARALITGEAAHVCAAAAGGPRYKAGQSPKDRKSITNAIWLCGDCNKKVDTDWAAWPEERLFEMKEAHEKWIAAQAMIPSLPAVSLKTRTALQLHEKYLPEITTEIQAALREQELWIHNPNRVEIFNLALDLTLPEAVVFPGHRRVPTGPVIKFGPLRPGMDTFVSGQARITKGREVITNHFRLEIDRLPAGADVYIGFYTTVPEQTTAYQLAKMDPQSFADPERMDEHKACYYHLKGTYQFLLRQEYVTAQVFVPLLFKAADRMIVSYPAQPSTAPWNVLESMLISGAIFTLGGNA